MVDLIKKDKIVLSIFVISCLSMLRSLIIPLHADELTYFKISENIFLGKYFLDEYPTTITPVIPFLFALFKTPNNHMLGLSLMKVFNMLLFFGGLRFFFLFLRNEEMDSKLIIAILLLVVCNPNSVAWFSTLYPESVLFLCFWGFIYFYNKSVSYSTFSILLIFLLLLVLSRYVYGILGVLIISYFYQIYKRRGFPFDGWRSYLLISVVLLFPILFWFKYVYFVESSIATEISYFKRFNSDLSFWDNIKYGLGIGIHPEVSRVNGIPAFVTLWIPITGLRNTFLSLTFLSLFIYGFVTKRKTKGYTNLFITTLLLLTGLVIAGTGFSRYWLVLIPSFLTGFVFMFKKIGFSNQFILLGAKIISIIYVINELRLDYLVLKTYL